MVSKFVWGQDDRVMSKKGYEKLMETEELSEGEILVEELARAMGT